MRPGRFLFLSLAFVPAAASSAEIWPGTTPLRFEVITAAGGLADIVPRELANHLSASLGVPVAVENRPGAGGNIAAALVAKAEPDGHMLLVTSSNQAVNPTLLPNPGFDYARDLAPVSMAAMANTLLVAAPAFPASDITGVIALAKQKPKFVSIAIAPIGTPNHLGAEMLAQYGDIDPVFVPYDGITAAMPDLIANRVDLAVASMSALLPQVRGGRVKALAVLSPQPSPFAPDIPTSAEAGLAALQINSWICIMTTGGTPAPIIARLDAEIAKALALPAVRDAFARQAIEIVHMNPQQLGAFIQSEAARFGDLLRHSRAGGPLQ
jgi:tripartite-type tricarboxylate transporter receptor subunit TctC